MWYSPPKHENRWHFSRAYRYNICDQQTIAANTAADRACRNALEAAAAVHIRDGAQIQELQLRLSSVRTNCA